MGGARRETSGSSPAPLGCSLLQYAFLNRFSQWQARSGLQHTDAMRWTCEIPATHPNALRPRG